MCYECCMHAYLYVIFFSQYGTQWVLWGLSSIDKVCIRKIHFPCEHLIWNHSWVLYGVGKHSCNSNPSSVVCRSCAWCGSVYHVCGRRCIPTSFFGCRHLLNTGGIMLFELIPHNIAHVPNESFFPVAHWVAVQLFVDFENFECVGDVVSDASPLLTALLGGRDRSVWLRHWRRFRRRKWRSVLGCRTGWIIWTVVFFFSFTFQSFPWRCGFEEVRFCARLLRLETAGAAERREDN